MISFIESLRSSDRWLLRLILIAVIASAAWFFLSVDDNASVSDVRAGGTLREGIIGTPRFVNPALALTRADQDMTTLIYRGLLKPNADGLLVPDIASEWSLSDDGTVYTFTLREDITFHDDIPLTSTDVVFTIELIQNNNLKSPLQGNWSGVTAEAVSDYTVTLTLEEPYAPFIENAAVGILPAHVWREIPIEQVPFSSYNTTPIGSGPYKIKQTTFSDNGTVAKYQLEPHANGSIEPLLSELEVTFYDNELELEAAWDDTVTSSAYLSPEFILENLDTNEYQTTESPLTRVFTVFFNQNRSVVLRDNAVREALELSINRQQLIDTTLSGSGIPRQQAVVIDRNALESREFHAELSTSTLDKRSIATMVLEDAGWDKTESGTWEIDTEAGIEPLQITIRTANTPAFEATAAALAESWESLGVTVRVEKFTQSDLLQSVIRDRDFEVLLFGIDPGRAQDVYPFWHSSQQNDPGLNIAQYTNLTVDDALETARTVTEPTEQATAYSTINTIIQEERPAIFLYQPTIQYVHPSTLNLQLRPTLAVSADRFDTVAAWHIAQPELWPFFNN